jgi:polysaccharide biosynthesis/export protein
MIVPESHFRIMTPQHDRSFLPFRRASLGAVGGKLLFLAVLAVAVIEPGCVPSRMKVAQVAAPPEIILSRARYSKQYLLLPGDAIDVVVQRSPEVSRAVLIRPDGKITLPFAGELDAAGLSPTELQTKITERLAARLVKPEVTVIPTQMRQSAVLVEGEVTSVAAVPLHGPTTAMQAITQAGGLKRSAASRAIAIIRLGDDGFIRAIPVVVPTNEQPAAYLALAQLLLQPDDIIFVPESGRSQFSRDLDDFVSRPLVGINAVIGTYLNFRFVQALTK